MPFETPDTLNQDDLEVLRDLRNRGFAVVVFTPDELEKTDLFQRDMEEQLSQFGNKLIAFYPAQEL